MKTVFRLHDGDTVQDCSPSGLEEKAEASLEGGQNAKGEHPKLDSEGEGLALRDL